MITLRSIYRKHIEGAEMAEHHTDDDPAKLVPEEARAGETSGNMRKVLVISMVAAIIVVACIAFFATA